MNKIKTIIGDTPQKKKEQVNPFNLHITPSFRQWLAQERISLAFTTYEAGKLVIVGSGITGGTVVTERNFERCMALYTEDTNIWISTHHNILQLENKCQCQQTES